MKAGDNISFYETNLVCRAASDIRCGTRAKPILADYKQHEFVKEAWLNHAGTVIGVVWEKNLTAIGMEYIGDDMPEVEIVSKSGQCKLHLSCTKEGESSCCTKESSKTCCKTKVIKE